MSSIASFFDKALDKIKIDPEDRDHLLGCIVYLVKQQNISVNWDFINNLDKLTVRFINSHQHSIGIILHPIAIPSADDITKLFFPIIIQIENEDIFYVMHKKKLYNPKLRLYESITPEILKKVTRAWQCCSVSFPISSNMYSLFKSVLQFFKKDIFVSVLLGLSVSATTLLFSMFSGYIFGNVHDIGQSSYAILFISFLVFILCSSVINCVSDLYLKTLNVKVMINVLPSVWSHIFNLPMAFTKKYLSGELVQRILDYESSLSLALVTILTIFSGIISILLLIGFMSYLSPLLALANFLIYLIFIIIKLFIFPKNIKFINSQLKENGKIASVLNETLLQIHKVRSANVEYSAHRRWLYKLIESKIHLSKSMQLETILWVIEILIPVSLLMIFYIYLYLYPKSVDIYGLLQFMICGARLSIVFEKLSSDMIALIHLLPGLKRLFPILCEEVEKSPWINNNIQFRGEIALSNISLRNDETGNPILEEVSLSVKPGSFVAIVGPSGAGKSTIFKLLLGFESMYSGTIAIDKENIKRIDMGFVRKQFGVVLQSTAIFPGTIFSNIAINANITLDEAWKLARFVGLDDEISLMPMKMYTHISDNAGESISGGQKQKILIARALATNPKVLFLDEATSALDNNSQALIYNNLKSLNISRLVIAHRYSTIVDADVIYVMDKGKIIDSGTYKELVSRSRL